MHRALALTATLVLAGPLGAAAATQDWPCIQPRQPQLSLGQMWSGPAPDATTAALARSDAAIGALATRLALRRVTPAEAAALIDGYAATAADAAHLTALAEAVLARTNAQRGAIIEGIGRYGSGQGAVASRIAARRATMDALSAAATPDYDAIDAEEERLDWDLRHFEERRQMLAAVCESPVLLEQRAFEIARLIQARLPGTGPIPAPAAGQGPAGGAGAGTEAGDADGATAGADAGAVAGATARPADQPAVGAEAGQGPADGAMPTPEAGSDAGQGTAAPAPVTPTQAP